MCRAAMRDVGADLGGSGSGVKADSDAAARRRKMTIQLREARRSLSEPDAIPSHSSAMVRLFAEINRRDRKSTRLNSSHLPTSRMPSSA